MNIASIATASELAGTAARNGPPWGAGPPPFAPLLGVAMFLLFILLTALAVFMAARAGRGGPPWAPRPGAPPEHEARKVLADRFARGDISVDEFLERASVLNWTPGSEAKGRK